MPSPTKAALCPKCRTKMKDRGVELVGGGDGKLHPVAVFECTKCGRLEAEERTVELEMDGPQAA